MRKLCFFLSLLVSTATTGALAQAQTAQRADLTCYQGTSVWRAPDGTTVGEAVSLVRRVMDPGLSRIVERVVEVGAPGSEGAEQHDIVLSVEGNRFTNAGADAAGMTIEGTLTGEEWEWTAWESSSTLPDGTRVTSSDTVTGGGLSVAKTVYGPDGAVVVTIQEVFTEMSCSEWETAVEEATGG